MLYSSLNFSAIYVTFKQSLFIDRKRLYISRYRTSSSLTPARLIASNTGRLISIHSCTFITFSKKAPYCLAHIGRKNRACVSTTIQKGALGLANKEITIKYKYTNFTSNRLIGDVIFTVGYRWCTFFMYNRYFKSAYTLIDRKPVILFVFPIFRV